MRKTRSAAMVCAVALVVAACGATSAPPTTEALTASAGGTSSTTAAPSTSAAPEGDATTTSVAPTTTVFDRLVEFLAEPPPFEEVTIATQDDVALVAKFWSGTSDVAVLFGHDFDNPSPGALGQRAAQSSDSVLLFSGLMADEGSTVLSPDFRGHVSQAVSTTFAPAKSTSKPRMTGSATPAKARSL